MIDLDFLTQHADAARLRTQIHEVVLLAVALQENKS